MTTENPLATTADAPIVPTPSTENPLAPPSAPAAPTAEAGPPVVPPAAAITALTGAPRQPAPPAQVRPGSFAQKLLTAIGGVLTDVGDASSAARNLRPGQGALTGVENTLAAGQARVEEQKRYQAEQARQKQEREDKLTQEQRIQQREDDESHARIAKSNVELHAAQQAAYYQGEKYMQDKVTQGKSDLAAMEGAEVPAQVIQRGLDEGQMTALMQQGKINGYEYTAIPTDLKNLGVDADGNPRSAFLYDIVKVPESWAPTDDQIARIKTVPGYEAMKKGTKLSGAQALSILRQADTIKTQTDARNKALIDAGLATEKEAATLEAVKFAQGSDWLKYVNKYQGNLVEAATHALQDTTMATKYPNMYRDIMAQFATSKDSDGTKEFEDIRHQYAVEAEQRVKDAQNGLNQIGGGAMTDEMKANIARLPKDKQGVVNKYDAPTQASLYSIAFGPGDLDFDRTFPSRVSAKSGQLDAEHAMGVIRQLNPQWSQQQYKQMAKAYHDVTFGRNGQDVETYNNLLDHMSAAQDVIEDTFRHETPKALNVAINALEKQGWGTQATKLDTALEPVKTEFENLMNAGHALHADQQKLYDAMVNPAMTPAQLEAAFKNFGATGVVRLMGLNDQYKKIAGKNVPGILRREAIESAKHLNLDAQTMQRLGTLNSGDTLFQNPNWSAGSPEEQRQAADTIQQQKTAADEAKSPTHMIFNSQAWAAAHPGQDVNAAITQARSKGYEVK